MSWRRLRNVLLLIVAVVGLSFVGGFLWVYRMMNPPSTKRSYDVTDWMIDGPEVYARRACVDAGMTSNSLEVTWFSRESGSEWVFAVHDNRSDSDYRVVCTLKGRVVTRLTPQH